MDSQPSPTPRGRKEGEKRIGYDPEVEHTYPELFTGPRITREMENVVFSSVLMC